MRIYLLLIVPCTGSKRGSRGVHKEARPSDSRPGLSEECADDASCMEKRVKALSGNYYRDKESVYNMRLSAWCEE